MNTPNQTPRVLTHDERKAAEAAFSGRPFNPGWSESARRIYDGLIQALPILPDDSTLAPSEAIREEKETVQAVPSLPTAEEPKLESPASLGKAPEVKAEGSVNQLITNRQEAIQSGFLIDVTTDAQKLGISFPITITKPLWEMGIAPSQTLSEEDKSGRLRDVLMAFRIRLASQTTLSPLIDFPAMLALPPEGVPQPVPLFAFIQADEQHRPMATLLLPNEVSASITPMN
ncbi:MAG: hypothetical protein H8K04_10780 [Nitrospira sp.]